jgi:hypothetical protein
MPRSLLRPALIGALFTAGITPALGQSDPADQLVGKWEGAQREARKVE